MKKLLYAIILALSVVLYAGCEEQVFDYDFINMPEGGGSTMVDSDRVIYYTTTDGHKIKTPIGITILESNVYEKGVGMLRYNKAVNNIPADAFSGFSTLETITLPESVVAIGEKAFYNCTSLKSVNIPEKVSTIGDEAFSSCSGELTINSKIVETDWDSGYPRNKWLKGSGFTKVVIGKKVEKIGNNTFRDYSSLTSVTIPNSVTSIGDYAFEDCSKLTRVNISNLAAWLKITFGNAYSNPLYNGADLYLNGNKLTALTIPSGITSLNDFVFYNCSSLTSVTIHDKVTSIGKYSFGDCSNLTRVNISNLAAWCNMTLSNGSSNPLCNGADLYLSGNKLTELVIPSEITSINGFTFYGYTSLTSVDIHNQVASIGRSVFSNCTGLTSVTIGNSVTSIEGGAFYKCSNLANVYCKPTTPPALDGTNVFDYGPSSGRQIYVPSASVDAYKTATNWSEYADQIVADPSSGASTTQYFIEYTSTDGNVVTPYDAKAFGVNIVSNVYENGKGRITFDGPVTKIGKKAFDGCISLTSLDIPKSVTSIGESAFQFCRSLASITIPDSVTSIGLAAFYGCSSLTSITIPDSVTSIGEGAFGSTALISFAIPDSVTSIGDLVFYECSGLTSVTIGRGVASISRGTFAYCTGLTSVTIPDSVTSIGLGAFTDCTSLTSLDIPKSVTSIGDQAFCRCKNLTSITIPESVTSIGKEVFKDCRGKIIINCNVPEAAGGEESNGILYASQFTELVIGDNVTSIGVCAFIKCTSLTSVTIGKRVTEIGWGAFDSCSGLTSVKIPSSVTSIGNIAFRSCTSLTSVYCNHTTPPAGGVYMFDNNASDRKIYVPSGSVDAYKTATNWSVYADCIVADPSSSGSQAYKVGDYYNVNGKQGVVFWVDETGKHGKIVSLTESILQWASDETEQKRLIGADDENNGANNMAVVKQIADWQSKYPAFKWCADLGEGWYLPAINELELFTLDQSVHDAVNQTLETKGVKLANIGDLNYYWSSTEDDGQYMSEFCAWYVYSYDGSTNFNFKYFMNCVRAVSAF